MAQFLTRSLIPFIFAFLFTISAGITLAQDSTFVCEPDSAFLESGLIISPPPFVNDTLGVGITREACINTPYEMIFQALTPNTIVVSGFSVGLDSISIDSISNLPIGLDFSCSGNNGCVILSDSLSCIVLAGTPTEENQPGEYELLIKLTAFTSIGAFVINYPDPTLAPGSYILTLNEEGDPNCEETTPVADVNLIPEGISLYPNPVSSVFTIEWESPQAGEGWLQLMNSTGQLMYQQKIDYGQGPERYDLQVDHLSPGMYMVGVQSANTRFWRRLIKE